MADIVIRGMEIPQWCSACACNAMHYCQVLKRDVSEFLMTNKFPEDCPLVPLPEGHGDLIDRDALKKRTPMVIDYSAGGFGTDGSIRPVRGYGDWQIDQAPIIVPAEGMNADV